MVRPAQQCATRGGVYQQDRRWATPEDEESTPVIGIDNVPSQANRLEEAFERAEENGYQLLITTDQNLRYQQNLVGRQLGLSSLEFPHRNADAYLRDARLGNADFIRTELGRSIFGATAQECGPLMAWFPQALLYGLLAVPPGQEKRHNTKHARAWVSEVVGWNPATTETRALGLKGDSLNLNTDESITSNPNDRVEWGIGGEKVEGGKKDKLSEIGHGTVGGRRPDAARRCSSAMGTAW